VLSDDGARLWVDGRPLVDDWTVRGSRERTGTIALEAGRRYDLRLEYFQVVATARVSLLWSSPSQKKEVIPARQLYPASSENHLIDEAFSSGAITPGLWDARLEGAQFEPGLSLLPPGARRDGALDHLRADVRSQAGALPRVGLSRATSIAAARRTRIPRCSSRRRSGPRTAPTRDRGGRWAPTWAGP
jgi:hypothetical protein